MADEPKEKKQKGGADKGDKPEKPQKASKGEKGDKGEKVATEYGADFKHLVRLSATDIKGTKNVVTALTGVKGVGIRLAPLVADKAQVPRAVKIGNLTDEQIEQLQLVLDGIGEDVPTWMVNRQRDIDSGEDLHLIGQDIDIVRTDDINRLKKIRSYRGARHEAGLPVRGQRTRANGRTGMSVGLQKKKEAGTSG